MDLHEIVFDLAWGIAAADKRKPVAVGARSGNAYSPGIGPHTESQTLTLAAAELADRTRWQSVVREVRYVSLARARCDLAFGVAPNWRWCIEVKMLRMMGDNGKPN